MEKHIYEDEDYKANYNKVVKALSTLKPLQNSLNNFHVVNINYEKDGLNTSFLEMIKHLTTTSRRYLYDTEINIDEDNKEQKVSISVNEKGIGYINHYSKHSTILCDDVYYIPKIKTLFKNKDAVLGISQLIKNENRVEFLKVVDLFNEFYNHLDEALDKKDDDDTRFKIDLENKNRLCLDFNEKSYLKYIYIDGLDENKDRFTLYCNQQLQDILSNYTENTIDDKTNEIIESIKRIQITDFIILNNLVLKQDEIIDKLQKVGKKEKELLLFVKKYKQLIDDKLKPLKAYEKL